MKSLESWEMASNASSSKSNSALVMLVNVPASSSPMNGDRPDNLKVEKDNEKKLKIFCRINTLSGPKSKRVNHIERQEYVNITSGITKIVFGFLNKYLLVNYNTTSNNCGKGNDYNITYTHQVEKLFLLQDARVCKFNLTAIYLSRPLIIKKKKILLYTYYDPFDTFYCSVEVKGSIMFQHILQ